MTIILTGSSGFLGRNLLSSGLINDKYIVHIPRSQNVETDEFCEQLLKLEGPLTVLHLATHYSGQHLSADIDKMIEANIRLPMKLAEALSRTHPGSRFVNISTLFQRLDSAQYAPTSLYASTKEAILKVLDFYAQSGLLNVVDLTVGDMYGLGDTRPKLIPMLLNSLSTGATVSLGSGKQILSLLHVDDTVRAVWAAMQIDKRDQGNETYRVAALPKHTITVRGLVELLSQLAKRTLNVTFDPTRDRPREIYLPICGLVALPNFEARLTLEAGLSSLIPEVSKTA